MALTVGSWQHAPPLKASDGTRIDIDYQRKVNTPADPLAETVVTAGSAWINVENPGFTANTKVRAVVIDWSRPNLGMPSQSTFEVDLQYAGGRRFTAPLPELGIVSSGPHAPIVAHDWELALVADGDWKEDPVNGTHNFGVRPKTTLEP